MELSARAIEEAVHPTAAFCPFPDETRTAHAHAHQHTAPQPSWGDSLLNPKNRIDSLALPDDPLWRIDGCAGLGTQYYTVPLFLNNRPPMRMDVFIPENQPDLIREQLDLDKAFHTKDAARLSRLAITTHIIRTLRLWTLSSFRSLAAFEQLYRAAPFGSRIVFVTMSLDIHQIRVQIGTNHNLERKLLSRSSLTSLWGAEFPFLQEVDFFDVCVIAVLHDSVCLVRIHEQLFIFKALVSGANYLYHELKTLCTLEPHHNVIARPIHIVKKACNFGGKKAVVGFTTFYHSQGSLRDILPQLRIGGQLRRSDQFKWSIQLTTALEHLRTTSATYYPDLRLDNVVLSDKDDIVMVDFEQRGVWCEFAAPEVNAIEYIRLLAADDQMPDDVQTKYTEMMRELVPEFDSLQLDRYTDPEKGYNVTWIALSPAEQEAAEVYMLGRMLWCIFEGVSGPQKAAVWQSYRWESDLEFPEYDRTPAEMRDLIDRCTRGRREGLASIIIRQSSRLVLRNTPTSDQSADDVRAAAKGFWTSEIEVAERFLDMRSSQRAMGTWNDNYYDRPTLKEVLTALESYRGQLM
ncbi:Uu.00g038470.m01.CDS01 [Anthostomella pinea]|uniref:Uu.00g038470.m01.CDS01 n=1 Tax=Anthostomella pinea TaxID=933095 RepID=A0AAI8V9P3_9PEZI|nr:Uu.00g038470.m01.CDS01 [Anthostomella pinea]